jgi:hypothetical protein
MNFFFSLVYRLTCYLFSSSSSMKDDPDATLVSEEMNSKTEYVFFLPVFNSLFLILIQG